jgi:hypothetical protein
VQGEWPAAAPLHQAEHNNRRNVNAAAPEVHNKVTMKVAESTQQQPQGYCWHHCLAYTGRSREAFRVQGSTALSLQKYTLVAWMLTPAGLSRKVDDEGTRR